MSKKKDSGKTNPQNDNIFNYTKLEYVSAMINYGIYASSVSNMNDPYESIDIDDPDDYRMICLSRSKNAKLMWSHYADKHKGCLVQFTKPIEYGTTDFILRRVNYSSTYTSRKDHSPQDIVQLLYTKDGKWKHELEVRAVCHLPDIDEKYWRRIGDAVYFKAKVKRIYLGCLTDLQSLTYYELLDKVDRYNQDNPKNKIEIKRYRLSEEIFLLKLDERYIDRQKEDLKYYREQLQNGKE